MELNEVRLEAAMELSQAITYLEDIVAALKSGQLAVEHEGDHICLTPQRTVAVTIKARQKRDKAGRR
jgi:amphi-Trp domain-containing protein